MTFVVFWALVIVALVFLWFCLSFLFKWLGRIGQRLYYDAKNEIIEQEEKESEEHNHV